MKYSLWSQWRYLGLLLGGALAFLRDPSQWIVNGFIDKLVFAGGGLLIGGLVEIGYRYRDRLKFSIRDIMLVTLVVALAVGWAAETSRNAPLRRKIKQLEFRFGVVKEELEGRGYRVVPDENGLDLRGPANNWMRSTSFDAPKGTRTMPFPDGPNPPKP